MVRRSTCQQHLDPRLVHVLSTDRTQDLGPRVHTVSDHALENRRASLIVTKSSVVTYLSIISMVVSTCISYTIWGMCVLLSYLSQPVSTSLA